MSMTRKREPLTPLLLADFPRFLDAFEKNCPFKRYGQLEYHVETIEQYRRFGSATAALADESFLRSLYKTLQSWGIGARASSLKPLADFAAALRERAAQIAQLEELAIDRPNLDKEPVCNQLWHLIKTLGIVTNNAKIVPGTKALHHVLPELVVPMDRAYTQNFFGWHNPQFQYGEQGCFHEAFLAFVTVAREVNPRQYVGGGWNTSLTKVIDNALVGVFCDPRLLPQLRQTPAGDDLPRS
jgi:hypothetical protein